MHRFDRYMLWQLLVAFGFFALVMVGVFWITRSVSLFDKLIRGGQSVVVFLEFTALSLPTLIRTVVPIAAFVATLYTVNRMSRESELTVMTATGASPWQLVRPVVYFGMLVAIGMSLLTWVLRPLSIERLDLREAEVSQDLTAQLLNAGEFLHPLDGVTFYIRELDEGGALRDVFISDLRDKKTAITFTASEAYVVRVDDGVNLVMVDGMSLQNDLQHDRMATTRFQNLTYDITHLMQEPGVQKRDLRALPTRELLTSNAALVAEGFDPGRLAAELHERISLPLMCIAVSMVAFGTLVLGSFSRLGLWPQVVGAFCLLIALEGLRSFTLPLIEASPALWPIAYLPVVIGVLLASVFLRVSGHPIQFRGIRATDGAKPLEG